MDSYRLHFYRPIRIWEKGLCWWFGLTFKHVNIEFTDGSEWLLDLPKRGLARVYKSEVFLREYTPDLTVTLSGVEYYSPEWVRAIASFRNKRLDIWGTFQYLRKGLREPINCASLVANFLLIDWAGTPDELLREALIHE